MRCFVVIFVFCLAFVGGLTGGRAEVPRVVATIKPLHGLAATVMAGIGAPRLLLRRRASPHHHALKPSDARLIQSANVVFWIGPELETFLEKFLRTVRPETKVIALARVPKITHWPVRNGGNLGLHNHSSVDRIDPHIWLDPINASVMVREIARVLGEADVANTAKYLANADREAMRLDRLTAEVGAALAAVSRRPYVVFHDAYQYFERRFGLSPAGALVAEPDRPPGARRLNDIRAQIQRLGVGCVFHAPQFKPALMATLLEGADARARPLDPLGMEIAAGPGAYTKLIRGMAEGFLDCLGQPTRN
jgi:zinc transport system substrate-binding protein